MVHEGIETQLPPGLAPKRRHIVQRKNVTARLLPTPLEPQDQDRALPAAPDRKAFPKLSGERLLVRSHLHGLRRQQPCGLMVPMSCVCVPPIVDDDVRPIRAHHAHHVVQDLIAPDFHGFFRRLRVAEIRCVCKKELRSIAARGCQQLLRANQAELRSLLRPEGVLAAFAAR